ncbi:hypothetical protein E2C01_010653 [Portunus trituberculatus]|uniref:Uncharacterized protein n=1 Tax=Portunus trituberculatus TaxID=210409 RepID=A0A5B7D902_PORTR|nr:hypothetical protein [Portunus trituberculatus]
MDEEWHEERKSGESLAVTLLHVVVEGDLALVRLVTVWTHLIPPLVVSQPVGLHVVDEAEGLAADVTRLLHHCEIQPTHLALKLGLKCLVNLWHHQKGRSQLYSPGWSSKISLGTSEYPSVLPASSSCSCASGVPSATSSCPTTSPDPSKKCAGAGKVRRKCSGGKTGLVLFWSSSMTVVRMSKGLISTCMLSKGLCRYGWGSEAMSMASPSPISPSLW